MSITRLLGALWVLAALLVIPRSGRAAEASVRVLGSAKLEAALEESKGGVTLTGRLFDDAGRAVGGGRVRVRYSDGAGAPLALPDSEACPPSVDVPDQRGLMATPDEVMTSTDASGRFCHRFLSPLPPGEISLSFEDQRELLDPATMRISVRAGPHVFLELSPSLRTLSMDDPEASITVEARRAWSDHPVNGRLELTLHRRSAPTTLLARRSMRSDESVRVKVERRALGAPGMGEIQATWRQGGTLARASSHVLVTATARVEVPERVTVESDGRGVLSVRVSSTAGPVTSGTVEAEMEGRTAGIAKVTSGTADVELSVGRGAGAVSVSVRYLPAAPWWQAGDPRTTLITVPTRGRLAQPLWVIGLMAVAAWIVAAWRRPPRSGRVVPPQRPRPTAEPSLHWAATPADHRGYSGRVRDAHDGRPIGGAVVTFLGGEGEPLGQVETDEAGTFCWAEASLSPRTLRVKARWHVGLSEPSPPPGALQIALVTHKRQLLARLVQFGRRKQGSGPDPTPGELARAAAAAREAPVEAWATAVERACFGPEPLDETEARAVTALEPAPES